MLHVEQSQSPTSSSEVDSGSVLREDRVAKCSCTTPSPSKDTWTENNLKRSGLGIVKIKGDP